MPGNFQRQRIDVICQHSKDGSIIPMRIRLDDEDGVMQTFNIKTYKDITTGDRDICVQTFDCKILVLDTLRPVRLFFNMKDGIWTIQK